MRRRQKVKDKAAQRHKALLESLAFQEFKRDGGEVSLLAAMLIITICC